MEIDKRFVCISISRSDVDFIPCNNRHKSELFFRKPIQPGLPKWPQFDPNNQFYLQLNSNNLTAAKSYEPRRMKFWLNTIPNIINN